MERSNYKLFLEDIVTSIELIQSYIRDMDFDDFKSNQQCIDAVIRNLEIIGEAANQIPKKIQKKYPAVPWAEMIGMRNIMIHAYFGIDHSIIWIVVTQDLHTLHPVIKRMLAETTF